MWSIPFHSNSITLCHLTHPLTTAWRWCRVWLRAYTVTCQYDSNYISSTSVANYTSYVYWANLLKIYQQGNFTSSPVEASPTLLSSRSSVFTDTVTGIAVSPSSTRARVTYPASSSTLYRSSSYRTVTTKGNMKMQEGRQCSTSVPVHKK